VFNEPFLSLVFNGKKKIESRFSKNRIDPYGKINSGDLVLIKGNGGPIQGLFVAGEIKFIYILNKNTFKEIESNFGKYICTKYDKGFWRRRTKTKYVSLISIKKIKKLNPFPAGKKDKRGWAIVKEKKDLTLF